MNEAKRGWLLAGAALLLGGLVVLDRVAGTGDGAASADAEAHGARGRYEAVSARVAEIRGLLAQENTIAEASARAEAEWTRAASGLLRGETQELAEARFREVVLSATEDLPLLSPVRISYVREGSASAGAATGSVRVLRLRVEFDAPNPSTAYTVVDRLEHLAEASATVESLRVDGPGRIQMPRQVTVGLTISAAALIGEGPA